MESKSPFQDAIDNAMQFGQAWMDSFGQSAQSSIVETQAEDWAQWMRSSVEHPVNSIEQQMDWWGQQVNLFNDCIMSSPAEKETDRRFKDPAWNEQALYKYIKESYKLACNNIQASINNTEGLDDETRQRLSFFSRQYLNAMSPSNFVATNPEIMKLTIESKGQNLIKGLEQLQQDLEQSVDTLNIRMTDKTAFTVGKNIATTPGKVVFKNDLFELIQYQATTEQVYKRPLLVVPPFVNKFYIMDLSPERSYTQWLVSQGHTVFMISWVNPNAEMAATDFGDYVTQGVILALDAIEAETGEREVNGIGYCIGGTLLTAAMAYLAGKRRKQRVKSATLLTTILDFGQPGELGVFINDPLISSIEAQNNARGYMDGRQMAVSFSLLRENSLYWNYYVTNYLKGESPVAFDLLHWNCDNTNITAATHNQILRQMYLENKLKEPGGITVDGVKVDLSKVKSPCYFLSAIEDHIAVWEGTFRGTELLNGDNTFVLAESGHIAGPMNPPSSNKYGFWTNSDNAQSPAKWLAEADNHSGSWWPHWQSWVDERNFSDKIAARSLTGKLDAPGEYVKQRIEDVIAPKEEVRHDT
ncbi:class I poly(R)-hydroxyalkanoic acid synthase [Shewanella pealeana]|uniref:Poly(R)-hydroxyalkanoic acid synthase, class I n=1 Tax=Shewanella pealeana (strain ATCC 700345 / ANG-SQ1) TaxID=398579 RepID=A8H3D8_SHEPA|nr:class I poly(R)-hydroxyalkanoic acid synthase [Shewanella pealeana]ABV87075.1 poly(R)-hydroxyalkanoic acid synthase, class I [Shewanella pealeana ATCC 700345]